MPASAPLSGLLPRSCSMNGAPSPIKRKLGTKVHHVASSPPSVPASIGDSRPGSRYAPRNPTNCTTMISGPGVVSAMPSPSSISPGEMLDGLGMAETTPGPLIMVVQFVGFLGAYRDPGLLSPMLAGTLGGLLATWCTFVPSFLFIGLGAPFIEQLRGNKPLSGALAGITAAVVGVILNLAIWFALHTWFREARHFGGYGLSI